VSERSIAGKFLERLLTGTVDAIARAGAKAIESVVNDAAKAIDLEKKKIEALGKGVAQWRKTELGEIGPIEVEVKVVNPAKAGPQGTR
jgi:hypothetical protein